MRRHAGARHPDPVRRSAVPDGLPHDAGHPPQQPGRLHRGRDPGRRRPGLQLRHPQDGRQRAHRALRGEAVAAIGCPGWSPRFRGWGPGYLASMGIYIFERQTMERELAALRRRRLRPPHHPRRGAQDARAGARAPGLLGGRRDHPVVLPGQPGAHRRRSRPFDFYQAGAPVYTHPRFLPASKVVELPDPQRADLRGLHPPGRRDRAVGDRHPHPHRRRCASCKNSLVLGADDYETLDEIAALAHAGRHPAHRHRRRVASSRTPSSTRTRASAAACASSTQAGCRRRTATATSSAKGSSASPNRASSLTAPSSDGGAPGADGRSMQQVRWGVLGAVQDRSASASSPPSRPRRAPRWSRIASRSPDKARAAAARCGIPRAYGSYEELLADPDVDAVYNPLPNHLHVPWSMRGAGGRQTRAVREADRADAAEARAADGRARPHRPADPGSGDGAHPPALAGRARR